MTPKEAVVLCRLVKVACPQQKFDEYTPDLWADMLADVEFDAARAAIVEVGKRQPWISPSDIIKESKKATDSLPAYRPMREVMADIEARIEKPLRLEVLGPPTPVDRELLAEVRRELQAKRGGDGV